MSKQAYETPLTTPKVRPSIRSSNSGRLASSTGPISRIASPTIGTTSATSRNVPTVGAALRRALVGRWCRTAPARGAEVHRIVKTIVSTPGQPEGQPGHRDRFVLPEVHVVDVDDVDDRDGERGDQDGDRHGTEDRRDQRDDERDGECDPVRLGTLPRAARHDRRDQRERRDRFVGLGRERPASSEIGGALVLAADVTEVGDLGELSPTTWALQRSASLTLQAASGP